MFGPEISRYFSHNYLGSFPPAPLPLVTCSHWRFNKYQTISFEPEWEHKDSVVYFSSLLQAMCIDSETVTSLF